MMERLSDLERLPEGPLSVIAALLEGSDRLNLAHTSKRLYGAGRGWFPCVEAVVTPNLDAARLARWLQSHKAPNGTSARAHLTTRGPANITHVPSALPVLSGHALTGLEVRSADQEATSLPLSALTPLTQLSSLSVRSCALGGSLDVLSTLTTLQSLDLDQRWLEQLPAGMTRLTRLTHLSLATNPGLGSSATLRQVLPQLTALQYLSLCSCGVAVLPERLSALKGLTYLDLNDNENLSTGVLGLVLPDMTALQSLRMWRCSLREVPVAVGSLTSLTFLSLAYNELSPASLNRLSSLTALQGIDLYECGLVGLPASMSALTRLSSIELGNDSNLSLDSLCGMLPHLVQLRALCLGSGTDMAAPGSLSNLLHALHNPSQLEGLALLGCSLVGLPQGMAALSSLTHLTLSLNKDLFPGSLNGALRHLSALQSLDLSTSMLVEVPAGIAPIIRLTRLVLSRNPLSGGWQHLRPLARLHELELVQVGLEELPPDLASLRDLRRLNLGLTPVTRGWHHLLALPRLRSLQISSNIELPGEVLNAIPSIERDGRIPWLGLPFAQFVF